MKTKYKNNENGNGIPIIKKYKKNTRKNNPPSKLTITQIHTRIKKNYNKKEII